MSWHDIGRPAALAGLFVDREMQRFQGVILSILTDLGGAS